MATPHWISRELFENALREFFGDIKLQILGYTCQAAIPIGENYTSDLLRATVTYNKENNDCNESISIIIKSAPMSGSLERLVQEIGMFDQEAEMFKKVLPAMYTILGESSTLSAKCIYAATKPHVMIMFEDLTTTGYKMFSRHQGFDLEHCYMVIEKMAKLHAASVVLYEQDPSLLHQFKNGLFADNETIKYWMQCGFKSLINASATWPGCEKYSAKMKSLGDKLVTNGLASTKRKLGGFNVLNHGDVWVNNMMFSYNSDGTLKDMLFLDYQLVIYSSPMMDLHYFWATSPKIEIKKEYFLEAILDRYYSQLLVNLSLSGYTLERVPTRKQFYKEWKERAFYGLVTCATVLPLVKATSRNDATFEDLMKSEEKGSFRDDCYNNERYRKHMEYLLPYYDDLGIFD